MTHQLIEDLYFKFRLESDSYNDMHSCGFDKENYCEACEMYYDTLMDILADLDETEANKKEKDMLRQLVNHELSRHFKEVS